MSNLLLGLCFAAFGAGEAVITDRVIAGSEADFLVARHVRIEGSNVAIGQALARIARDRHEVELAAAPAAHLRSQAEFYRRFYPQFWERMEGVADVFGVRDRMDAVDCSSLGYPALGAGCSVAYYPPDAVQEREALLSRNYDFTTGTFDGKVPAPGELPATARPYLLELHPDDGHASLAMVSYDLLGVALDGVNSAGLTVALLADDELMEKGHHHPMRHGSGLGEAGIVRYLLDRCGTIEEARLALSTLPQYYSSIPCHYLVGDARGNSFVFEFSASRSEHFVFPGGGRPQLSTNFMLHLHRDLRHLPQELNPLGFFRRFESMQSFLEGQSAPLSLESVCEANRRVAAASRQGQVPGRTLWYALYRPRTGTIEVDFYLGEGEDGKIRRSGAYRAGLPPDQR